MARICHWVKIRALNPWKGVVNMTATKSKGKRGWFGDSAAHAEAGRKGGQARSQRNNESSEAIEAEMEDL